MDPEQTPDVPSAPVILVADDEPGNIAFLRNVILREFPAARVVPARDGAEAIALLASEAPDLVLLDLSMPGVDGFAVLEHRENLPDGRLVPVMVLSSYGLEDTANDAMAAGADDFLAKPFGSAAVIARVRSLLRIRQQYRALLSENRALAVENDRLRGWLTEALGPDEALERLRTR